MNRILLTHASVVLADEIRSNLAVLIEGDRIVAIDPETTTGAFEMNLAGRILMPGERGRTPAGRAFPAGFCLCPSRQA